MDLILTIVPYVIATLGGFAFYQALKRLPSVFNFSREKAVFRAQTAEKFYGEAERLLKDDRTPEEIIEVLALFSNDIDNKSVMRSVLWSALRGDFRRHAKNPSQTMRQFHKALHRMPNDLRESFGKAVACGLMTMALGSGVYGEIFLRLMLPNPKAQKDSAVNFAAEMAARQNSRMRLAAAA